MKGVGEGKREEEKKKLPTLLSEPVKLQTFTAPELDMATMTSSIEKRKSFIYLNYIVIMSTFYLLNEHNALNVNYLMIYSPE